MLKKTFLKIVARATEIVTASKAAFAEPDYFPIDAWQQCIGDVTERGEFISGLVGDKCYAAFLEKQASATLVLLFPPSGKRLKYSVLYYSLDRDNSTALVNRLKRCFRAFRVRKVALDRWSSARNLMLAFFRPKDIIDVGMGFMGLSTATNELLGMILGATIDHGGDAKLVEMARRTAFFRDSAGNIKPDKARSGDIDGIVALIMAIAVMLTDE